jgi:hypothetical protein
MQIPRRLDGPGSSEDPRTLSPYATVCSGCVHFRSSAFVDRGARTCEAFPNGIPAPIWNGQNTHRRPYPGDRGIVYEPLLVASEDETGIASGG